MKSISNEKYAAEKAERIESVKSKLLDGSITALSIDACIFTENGNRLDEGTFKHLEQFNQGDFRLVFSEVSLREVHAHIRKEAEEAKNKFVSSLRSVGKHWCLTDSKEDIVKKLIGTNAPKDIASQKINNFVKRCGVVLVEASDTVDLKVLLKRYFDTQPPFETSAEKKSEFPDAIAMLSLDGWAEKNSTSVIFVTKDKGCKRYCAESEFIYAIDSLSDALSLIQERDKHCLQLCQAIELKIAKGSYPDLMEQITDIVGDNIWRIDWDVDASAAFYFEQELHDVELVDAEFDCSNGRPSLRAVDYSKDLLVVQCAIEIKIDAICDFSFSVKDGIDHDMVDVGSASVSSRATVELDILITFENPNHDLPELVEIELVPERRTIDFGYVEPDYGDEDPSSDYY